jgi:hypothetical protein
MNAEKQQATPTPTNQRTYSSGGKAVLIILVLSLATSLLVRGLRHLSPSDAFVSSHSHASGLPLYWTDVDVPSSLDSRTQRPVYPYSVIPGGAVSSKELVSALHRDPVAAAHYSDFRAASARIMRLTNPRQVYVSYRLGDRVYWSSKKITLAAGETILTDGAHLARTRCGNRISEVPGPTSPAEPPKEAMNRPVYRQPADGPADTFPAAPLWRERTAPTLMALNGPVSSGPGGNNPFLPPIPIGPCCSAPGGPSGSSPKTPPPPSPPPGPGPSPLPQPPTPPGPPPVATPEPQALLLLIVGLSALFVTSLFRRS